jgi:hypothetical protein
MDDHGIQYFQFDLSSAQENDYLIVKAFSVKEDLEIGAR